MRSEAPSRRPARRVDVKNAFILYTGERLRRSCLPAVRLRYSTKRTVMSSELIWKDNLPIPSVCQASWHVRSTLSLR